MPLSERSTSPRAGCPTRRVALVPRVPQTPGTNVRCPCYRRMSPPSYPHTTSSVQAAMGTHLCRCFELQSMSPFPAPRLTQKTRETKNHPQAEWGCIYCVCRLPWDKYDHQRGPLVQCCKYAWYIWYHIVYAWYGTTKLLQFPEILCSNLVSAFV